MGEIRDLLFGWRKPLRADEVRRRPAERTWHFDAADSPMERAHKLAEIALADFVNDRHGMIDRAAFRIARVMEIYAAEDAAARAERQREAE